MDVLLRIHLEKADGEAVWWAETDDVAGFSAAADDLVEMRTRALAALEEIARELGAPLGVVREELVPTVAPETMHPSSGDTDSPHRAATYAIA